MRRIQDSRFRGWGSGLLGVLIFSGSLPATRLAVAGFAPLLLTSLRAAIAGVLAGIVLTTLREPRPDRAQWARLAIVAGGCVLGFPLLTALALQHITSARSLVFIGLLPLSTALFGVLRGGERPRPGFWLFACLGAGAVMAYALGRGAETSGVGDGLMALAILVCGLGYAEGAVATRSLGGWQVISWALVMALPTALLGTALFWPSHEGWPTTPTSWLGLGYVSVFSMFVGFIFWYRGLSSGGIAGVGQLQLLQPFLGLGLAHVLLGEPVEPAMIGVAATVVASVAGARRFA